MTKSRTFTRALKSLGKVPRRNPGIKAGLPSTVVKFALKHRIPVGSRQTGHGKVYFIRDPRTLHEVETTRGNDATASDAMAMMRRYLRRGVKSNPSPREAEQAAQLFQEFTGHEATKEMVTRQPNIRVGLAVGKLAGVMYEATRDGRTDKYFHRFKKSSQPLLIASHDGSQLGIVGGRYRFTDRGIEDK